MTSPAPNTNLDTDIRPFSHAQEHLDAMILRVWLLLQRFVARYGYRMFGSGDSFQEAFSGFVQAMDQIKKHGNPTPVEPWHQGHWPSPEALEQTLEQHDRMVEQRLKATLACAEPFTLPLEELRARFGLSNADLMVLIAIAAPQLSVDLARACSFAMASPAWDGPTCGFAAELVANGPQQARRLLYNLDASGTLVRRGLLQIHPSQTNDLHNAPVSVPRSVLRFMSGVLGDLPETLVMYAQQTPFEKAPKREALVLADSVGQHLINALRRAIKTRTRLVLVGAPGSGKRSAFQAYLAELGIGLMTIDLHMLMAEHENPVHTLRRLVLEASLKGFALLLRYDEQSSHHSRATMASLRLVLDDFDGILAVSTQSDTPTHALFPDASRIELPTLTTAARKRLWCHLLEPELERDSASLLAQHLVQHVRATPGLMVQSIKQVTLLPAWHNASNRASLISEAVRNLHSHALGELAEPMSTSLRWEDAVLAEETAEGIEEIIIHATYQHHVLNAWGMNRKLPYGRGLSCLFYGPPGTGKTMTATLVAKRLKLPLFRVELSKIVSKYIGETEKNLAQLFEQAERAGGILLFDEADALFAKRTKVQGSNDRYANMKVNYLLQRMESYDGITILTTNLDKDLDEALRRRLRFRLYFPKPDADLRAQLWENLLPEQAHRDADLDLQALAKKFDFAGGYIKNAVLRAAFQAAHEDTPINTEHLNRAALREARELGMLVRD